MKPAILMLHNRYLIRGGEDESTDAEASMLRDYGHHVELLELHNQQPTNIKESAHLAVSSIWSRSAFQMVRARLATRKFDLLHVQNFFPNFSPAVYYAARLEKTPVIQALRNYRLVCASANLFRDGEYCNDCVGRKIPAPAVLHRCYRNSALGSATIGGMQVIHRAAGTWKHKVGRYVAITDFVRQRLIEGGLPASKICVKSNFVPHVAVDNLPETKPFALYVGRLTSDKGIDWLVQQWLSSDPGIDLKIIGAGELKTSLIKALALRGNDPSKPSIEFLGQLPQAQVYATMRAARFLVVPGSWPEPFGRIVVEAYAVGTPVIAASAGGLPELVRHGETGFLFAPGDAKALLTHVETMVSQPRLRDRLGSAAYGIYQQFYTAEANYVQLAKIYRDVLEENRLTLG